MTRTWLHLCLVVCGLGALATAGYVAAQSGRLQAFAESNALVDKAQDLGRLGRPRESLEAAQEAAALAPDNPRARRELAMHFIARGELREAAQELRAAFAANRFDSGIARELAAVLGGLRDPRGAMGWLRRAARLEPYNGLTYAMLASYLTQVGEFGSARAAGERAVRLAPQLQLAQFSLGLACWKSGDRERAGLAFRQALALNPSHVPTLYCLAGVAGDMGRTNEAIGYLVRALALSPDTATGWAALGAEYLSVHRPTEAARAFRRALQLDPKDSIAQQGMKEAMGKPVHGREAGQ